MKYIHLEQLTQVASKHSASTGDDSYAAIQKPNVAAILCI
jgi:hypothetical protein